MHTHTVTDTYTYTYTYTGRKRLPTLVVTGQVLTGVRVQLTLLTLVAVAAHTDVLVDARELAHPTVQAWRTAARI